jgi:hypothetical protein
VVKHLESVTYGITLSDPHVTIVFGVPFVISFYLHLIWEEIITPI